MESQILLRRIGASLLMAGLVTGCGKKEDTAPAVAPTSNAANQVASPDGWGGDSVDTSFNYGATVRLEVEAEPNPTNPSQNYYPELSNLLRSYPINSLPSTVELNVNLHEDDSDRSYGHVQIRFYDNNRWNILHFRADNVVNSSDWNLHDKGVHQAEYNRWFTLSGEAGFSGYFQGGIMSNNGGWLQWMASVVLVINDVQDQGDGQGTQYVSGEIWYKNLKEYNTQNYSYGWDWWNWYNGPSDDGYPERMCWFIYSGPLACRSNTVMNKSSFTPDGGFRKLGEFRDLPKYKAFNIE